VALIGVRETEIARFAAAEAARATDMAAEWRDERYEDLGQGKRKREARRDLGRGEDVETPNRYRALIGYSSAWHQSSQMQLEAN
jgi:hypothetical protein